MALAFSSATEDEIRDYTEGLCHVFAVALHRMTGWRIHLVLDAGERYWEDPEDPDNWIPAVCHAFCLDSEDNAWDIKGVRPLGKVWAEMKQWLHITEYEKDELTSEAELTMYVGCWAEDGSDPIDRPLVSYEEDDVNAAAEVVNRVLAGLPGFPNLPAPTV